MAKIDYKTMLKADWQKLAGDYNIEFKTKSTIRYLVEKVAEKIGVDDKIVDDEELKKAVLEKIHSSTEKKTKTKTGPIYRKQYKSTNINKKNKQTNNSEVWISD